MPRNIAMKRAGSATRSSPSRTCRSASRNSQARPTTSTNFPRRRCRPSSCSAATDFPKNSPRRSALSPFIEKRTLSSFFIPRGLMPVEIRRRSRRRRNMRCCATSSTTRMARAATCRFTPKSTSTITGNRRREALPGAQIAWTRPYEGTDQSAVAYSKQWNNPQPNVEIKSINMIYGRRPRGVPVLIAVTTAVDASAKRR